MTESKRQSDTMLEPETIQIRQYMTRRHLLALCLIGGLVIIEHLGLVNLLRPHDEANTLIHVSGHQGLLSQRAAFLASQLVTVEPLKSQQRLREDLRETARQIDIAHRNLTDMFVEQNGHEHMSETLNALYFQQPYNIDERLKNFTASVIRLSQNPSDDLNQNNEDYQLIVAEASPLLKSLDEVVWQYQLEAAEVESFHRDVSFALVLSILAVLVLELFLIFRPMVSRVVRVYHDALKAKEAKTDFLASISHEILTPMNGIIGNAELMLGNDLDVRQKNRAATILFSAESLLEIINDILDYSKIESGKMTLEEQSFNLKSLVEDIITQLSQRTKGKNLEFSCKYLPDTPELILSDPARLRQVLSNLLGNALKFTEAGHVLVTVKKAVSESNTSAENATLLEISVEDTGVGIPSDKLESIFQKFTQADGSMSGQYGGTGLGLAICKETAELMNGEIRVQSTQGVGSIFIVSVPVKVDTKPIEAGVDHVSLQDSHMFVVDDDEINKTLLLELDAAQHSNENTNRASHAGADFIKGRKVLLVEDNRINQALAEEILEEIGVEVICAANGKIAVDIMRDADDVDFIFMDCQMPEMDGFEATAEIRKLSKQIGDRTPIIALTANAMEGDKERCFEAGMDDYMAKPVRKADVKAALDKWMPRKTVAKTSDATAENLAKDEAAAAVHQLPPSRHSLGDDLVDISFGVARSG